MAAALYGPGGFFVRPDNPPGAHFRTSTHASPMFAAALLRLLEQVDTGLGRPDPLDLVDVGAGRGELLTALVDAAPPPLVARLRPVAVDLTPRPPGLPPTITWSRTIPPSRCGLLLACEWLDNVPVDAAERGPDGVIRYLLVDPATGAEATGDPVTDADLDWLRRWWPLDTPGTRAEIGRSRDEAWAATVATVERGLALAIDYGHAAGRRPPAGTLTGFRHGRQVPPVPDGSCDLTAHVAMDALASSRGVVVTQREALHRLGVHGARPPLDLARRRPADYLRRLAAAGEAAELTDPAGLGAHLWLLQPVALPHPPRLFVGR
jgi:SAM-dependent MidA family methyltransferase